MRYHPFPGQRVPRFGRRNIGKCAAGSTQSLSDTLYLISQLLITNDLKLHAQGYNATLLAYGQTGSGKSYSMMGYGPNKGLIPKLCDRLFQAIKENQENRQCQVKEKHKTMQNAVNDSVCKWSKMCFFFMSLQVFFSMLEIYNEQVVFGANSFLWIWCYDAIMFPDSSFSSPLCPGGWLAVSGVSDSGRAQSQRGAATRILCGGSPHSPLRDCSSGREMNRKRIQTKPNNCTSQRLRLQSCAVNIRIFRELNALWSSSKRASRSSPAWICWNRQAVIISIHQSQKLTELKRIRPSVWAPPHWAMSKHAKGHAAV